MLIKRRQKDFTSKLNYGTYLVNTEHNESLRGYKITSNCINIRKVGKHYYAEIKVLRMYYNPTQDRIFSATNEQDFHIIIDCLYGNNNNYYIVSKEILKSMLISNLHKTC